MKKQNLPILVVEDDPIIREVIKATLSDSDYRIETAKDGLEALAIAKEISFRFVLTDVRMPGMDGIELVTELRKLPDYQLTPILILTTDAAEGAKLKGKKAGATGWIVKPYDPDTLVKVIDKFIHYQFPGYSNRFGKFSDDSSSSKKAQPSR